MLSMRVIIHNFLQETEQMMVMFHGLMMYVINDCHFQGNINTRYCFNKIMDFLEIKPEFRIRHRISKKANNILYNLFSK